MDLHALEEELKRLGVTIVSSRQDTIVSIRIKGLAGKALDRGLRLCDQLLREKVKNVLKTCTDASTKLFVDPTFGPTPEDPQGACALCKTGKTIPSKGGSQHQLKILGLLKAEKLRWERPEYATNDDDGVDTNQEDEEHSPSRIAEERVFASDASLFSDGVSSGDVIQGNLGDCWFLSALSVVATRSDLLEQTFWRGDTNKSKGLFVCKFMKNYVWNYVIIDDRLPVYGFSKTKEGKPYFARCRDPNELWVSLLEKAYAKLHGSYEALIGGFIDVALNDLTGFCSEQVIMKSGYPGFGEDPFLPAKPHQQAGDPFWDKIIRYKSSGTLMGCSIQPAPSSMDKSVAPESSAGNGLYFKHAYALVDAATVKTVKGEQVKLVKLRNPWGMGEWTGPWSDSSEERVQNQDVIEQYFKILKRRVGGNLSKRVFLSLNGKGEIKVDEIAQEEIIEINANDGTFFMSYEAWMQYFTHFFAGIDFPDEWHGRRVEGCWSETNCGGNTTKSTWINNPRFQLIVQERSQFFITLSQEDPRGKENLKIVPIGFHVCSLTPVSADKDAKCEIKEPTGKDDAYYRLYKDKDRAEFKKGIRPEQLPPAIIPGSVIKGIDDDGVPQPAYTFKQAVSVDVTMEPGKYCIIPSMYMRTDKDTGKTNVGSFWVSVYSNKSKFTLEGGERIVEEEEGEEDGAIITMGTNPPVGPRASFVSLTRMNGLNSPGKKSDSSVSMDVVSATEQRRRFEDAKDELLAQAKAKGIGLRQLKMEFAKAGSMKKSDMRKKMLSVGFKPDELSDDKINVIFSGLDESSKGSVDPERILNMFEVEIHEDQMACEVPEVEDDDVPEKVHDDGVLSVELRGARDLVISKIRAQQSPEYQHSLVRLPTIEYNSIEANARRQCAISVSQKNPGLAYRIRKVLSRKRWFPPGIKWGGSPESVLIDKVTPNPFAEFFNLLEDEIEQLRSAYNHQATVDVSMDVPDKVIPPNPIVLAPVKEKISIDCSQILHRSNQMQTLEGRRRQRLSELKRKKQETLGDQSRTALLPRLIGGRKSGSTYVQCSDCAERVLVPGRAAEPVVSTNKNSSSARESFVCSGSRCFSVLCLPCHKSLPATRRVCEDCYEHELTPTEALGSQLRSLLIDKIGKSKDQRAQVEQFFKLIDQDNSGALSYEEFSQALSSLEIQPPLSREQIQSLMEQFDTNTDGEISLKEFHDWVFLDQVWQPQIDASNVVTRLVEPETHTAVITPLVEYVIEIAFQAGLTSSSLTQWVATSNSASSRTTSAMIHASTQVKEEFETGSLVFRRVNQIKIDLSGENDSIGALDNTIDDVFARHDTDGSGQIDEEEFHNMLSGLGLQLSRAESQLLINRIETAATRNNIIDLAEFRSYAEKVMVDKASQAFQNPLVNKLVRIEANVAVSETNREEFHEIAQQLHWNLRCSQAARISALFRRRIGIEFSAGELQRIANIFHVREIVPTRTAQQGSQMPQNSGNSALDQDKLLDLNNSGDVLCYLTSSTPLGLSIVLKPFDLIAVCRDITSHLENITKCSSPASIWTTTFGGTASVPLDQRVFLDKLILSGFTTSGDATDNTLMVRLKTKVLVAIALDTLRGEMNATKPNDEWSWSVSFSLFTVLIQRSDIDAIERRFAHVFRNFMNNYQGIQNYLIEVALENDNMIVRAIDPIRKYRMSFVVHPHEFSRFAVAQLSPVIWPRDKPGPGGRHAAFVKDPGGLITEATHPIFNQAFLELLSRLRIRVQSTISAQHTMTPYLVMVEDESFLLTLETMLARAYLPFFWSVSPTTLEFTIDGDYLTQMQRVTFHQLVADTLSTKTAAKPLRALLKFTASSLNVRYEIVGQNAAFDSAWADLQALLSGQQNTFAILEIRPQGDSFITQIDKSGGNGAPKWNFKQPITLKEPEQIEHRVDSAVIYSDTVRVSAIPNGSSLKRITFSFAEPSKVPGSGHFVVLSVRRATPEKNCKKSRLYCTAYDPFTSSDFAVEGYPTDWSPDFFNTATNREFDSQWVEAVKAMSLGPVLTPKVVVKVYTKHSKIERLIGECEVSLSPAIAHEGHVFDDWYQLSHPLDLAVSAGAVNLAFCFDSKKSSPQKYIRSDPDDTISVSSIAKTDERRGEPSTHISQAELRRVAELEKALQQAEAAKLNALEQVRRMKEELDQKTIALTHNSRQNDESSEVLRWKSKLEQVRREQESQQAENEKRIAAVQAELNRIEALKQEKDEETVSMQSTMTPTNLRTAALGNDASAHDILSTMKDILTSRSPDRPYNGLKKAIVAVAEAPGKVSVGAFEDVLDDFGLGLSAMHKRSILNILDPDNKGRVNIEDFFIKLCGDAESNPVVVVPKTRSPLDVTPRDVPPIEQTPSPESVPAPAPPISPPRQSSTIPAPARPQKMSWKEMRKMLLINLPEGWETRYTEKGRPYFCNHANRSTQWKHPLPEVDAKYNEWIKENGAIFQRHSNTVHPSRK